MHLHHRRRLQRGIAALSVAVVVTLAVAWIGAITGRGVLDSRVRGTFSARYFDGIGWVPDDDARTPPATAFSDLAIWRTSLSSSRGLDTFHSSWCVGCDISGIVVRRPAEALLPAWASDARPDEDWLDRGVHERGRFTVHAAGWPWRCLTSTTPRDRRKVVPMRPYWRGLIANTLVFLAAILIVVEGPRYARRSWRRRQDRCADCGYPSGHGPSVVCAECGRPA